MATPEVTKDIQICELQMQQIELTVELMKRDFDAIAAKKKQFEMIRDTPPSTEVPVPINSEPVMHQPV